VNYEKAVLFMKHHVDRAINSINKTINLSVNHPFITLPLPPADKQVTSQKTKTKNLS